MATTRSQASQQEDMAKLQSLVYNITESVNKMQKQLQEQTIANKDMQHSIQQLQEKFTNHNLNQTQPSTSSANHNSNESSSSVLENMLKGMKLEIPTFEGEDPLGWIFQAQKFFNFHSVPDY